MCGEDEREGWEEKEVGPGLNLSRSNFPFVICEDNNLKLFRGISQQRKVFLRKSVPFRPCVRHQKSPSKCVARMKRKDGKEGGDRSKSFSPPISLLSNVKITI